MKVDQIYFFKDDMHPVVLWEFAEDQKDQANKIIELSGARHTRQTCFMSNGLYYVGEYITDDIAQFLISNNKVYGMNFSPSLNFNDCKLFYVEQGAYGDWRYYFNNKDKQFYREFISIGD